MGTHIRHLAAIVLGNLLVAFAVTAFIVPHGLVLGGSTGISLVATRFVPLQLSLAVLIVNGLLFVVGSFFLGKTFAASTIVSTVAYPLAMAVLEMLPIAELAQDHVLAAICGGAFMGAGADLILRAGGSSGGTDVIALIAHKYLHLNVSALLWGIDAFVIACQFPFSSSEQILLGILALSLLSIVMNKVMVMGRSQVQLLIFSPEYAKIRELILTEQDAGATMLPIEQGYTRADSKAVLCVIPRRKLWPMREMINSVDPHAFWVISEVSEVRERELTRRVA